MYKNDEEEVVVDDVVDASEHVESSDDALLLFSSSSSSSVIISSSSISITTVEIGSTALGDVVDGDCGDVDDVGSGVTLTAAGVVVDSG
jgi:hypothetical protein